MKTMKTYTVWTLLLLSNVIVLRLFYGLFNVYWQKCPSIQLCYTVEQCGVFYITHPTHLFVKKYNPFNSLVKIHIGYFRWMQNCAQPSTRPYLHWRQHSFFPVHISKMLWSSRRVPFPIEQTLIRQTKNEQLKIPNYQDKTYKTLLIYRTQIRN